MAEATKKQVERPKWTNFATGASAAVSGWMFVHPFDVVKVRAQLSGGSTSLAKSFIQIGKSEGIQGLYSGLSAAIVRQLTYGNLRLGLYATIRESFFPKSQNLAPSNIQNLGFGLTAGGIAAFISNPIEVSLVRMQADGRLEKKLQRNYKNVFDALTRITREEGVKALWSGSSPTVARAMVVNAIQIGGYEAAKNTLTSPAIGMKENVFLHLSSSLIAGFCYSFITLPLDTAKTRMQTATSKAEYPSIVKTISKIAKNEGVKSLWNGFLPYFCRCGGHTVTMFLFLEQYKKLADSMYAN